MAAGQRSHIAWRLGDDVLLSRSLLSYLAVSDVIGPAESGELFAETIACAQRSGDEGAKYLLHLNASDVALAAGDVPVARAHVEQAIQAARTKGPPAFATLVQLSWVLRAEHNPDEARSTLETALRTTRRNGERQGVAYATLGLAFLAADAHDWDLAAKLHGAAQAAIDRTGLPWQPLEERYRQQSLQQVRAALGDQQLDRAYTTGTSLSSDAAISLALGRPPATGSRND